MSRIRLKFLVAFFGCLAHLFGTFVAWAIHPGNMAVKVEHPGLWEVPFKLFAFPLITWAPQFIANEHFELLALLNSALMSAVWTSIGFAWVESRSRRKML